MGMEGSGRASSQAGWHRQSWARLLRIKPLGRVKLTRLPVGHSPASQSPEALGDLEIPKALIGQPRKWEEMGVRVGREENIASG